MISRKNGAQYKMFIASWLSRSIAKMEHNIKYC